MNLLTAYFITLCAHILFDFVFQGQWIAKRKKFLNGFMLAHGISVSMACSLIVWSYYQTLYSLVGSFMIIFCTHIMIDSIKVELSKRYKNQSQLLGLDQIFHATVLFLLYSAF